MKYGNIVDEWYKDKIKEWGQQTIAVNELYINLYIKKYLGEKEIADLSRETFLEFNNMLSQKLKIADITVSKINSVNKNCVQLLVDKGYIEENFIVEIVVPRVKKNKIELWSMEELERFLVESRKSRFFILYFLAIKAGLTQAEVVPLRWKDIDFINGLIYIDKKVNHSGTEIEQHEKPRMIKMRADTYTELYLYNLGESKLRLLADEDYIVMTSNKNHVLPRNFIRDYSEILKENNLKQIPFKNLRYLYLLQGVKSGESIVEIMKSIGSTDYRVFIELKDDLVNEEKSIINELARKHNQRRIFTNEEVKLLEQN